MMLAALRHRLTYANVMATLALFVALGGASYAALELPRDSVGASEIKRDGVRGSEIRSGAVRSAEVKDRSLEAPDLSFQARRSLRGNRGDTGPVGPAGEKAIKYFATMAANGTRVRGNATSGGNRPENGRFSVGFGEISPADLRGCVFTATLGTTDDSAVPPGRITVHQDPDGVGVRTYDPAGNPTDLPFHVIAAC